jgi:hypothetical protein
MFGFSDEGDVSGAWAEAARLLGLSLRRSKSSVCDSLAALRDTAGPIVTGKPSMYDWMVGRWRDVEVFVLLTMRRVGPSDDERREFTTHVIAGIDPPLFAGLVATSRSAVDALFGGRPPLVGHPPFDAGFDVRAALPARAVEILRPVRGGGADAIDQLALWQQRRVGVDVTDNLVTISASGQRYDVVALRSWLDAAAWIASALAERCKAIAPPAEGDVPLRAWEDCARAHALAFDGARALMDGVFGGVGVSLRLDTIRGAMTTQLRARFPSPLGLGLSIARDDHKVDLWAMLTAADQDIIVGDPAFDTAFVVKGNPPQHVQRLLAWPEARARLLALLYRAPFVWVTDEHLGVEMRGALAQREHLEALLTDGTRAVTAMMGYPSWAQQQPFR